MGIANFVDQKKKEAQEAFIARIQKTNCITLFQLKYALDNFLSPEQIASVELPIQDGFKIEFCPKENIILRELTTTSEHLTGLRFDLNSQNPNIDFKYKGLKYRVKHLENNMEIQFYDNGIKFHFPSHPQDDLDLRSNDMLAGKSPDYEGESAA